MEGLVHNRRRQCRRRLRQDVDDGFIETNSNSNKKTGEGSHRRMWRVMTATTMTITCTTTHRDAFRRAVAVKMAVVVSVVVIVVAYVRMNGVDVNVFGLITDDVVT